MTKPLRLLLPVECFRAAGARLGEGPVWDAGGQRCWWVDILAGQLHASAWAGPDDDQVWELGDVVGCAIPARDGRWLLGRRHDLAWFDPADASITSAVPVEADLPKHRVNDGKAGPDGAAWFGSIAGDDRPAAFYRWHPDQAGAPTVIDPAVRVSNGLGWSPDGRTLYHTDSPAKTIWQYPFDPATGTVGPRSIFCDTGKVGFPGVPDGLAVDELGRLWSALWDGHGLAVIEPDGRAAAFVELPVRRPTACAFGGPAGRHLLVTSAGLTPAPNPGPRDVPTDGDLLLLEPGVAGPAPFRLGGQHH